MAVGMNTRWLSAFGLLPLLVGASSLGQSEATPEVAPTEQPQAGPASDPRAAEQPSGKAETPDAATADQPGGRAAAPPADTQSVNAVLPRFELHVPSARQAVDRIRGSRGGWFAKELIRVYLARAEEAVEGLRPQQVHEIAALAADWPDTRASLFIFAPDLRSRPRWAISTDWPVADLHGRLKSILDYPGVAALAEGLLLSAADGGKFRIALGGEALACLIPLEGGKSAIASHCDLPIPSGSTATGQSEPSYLLSATWSLSKTEADSGATVFSSFSAVTHISYEGSIDAEGAWIESVQIHWPPLSGMGAKALFSRVKQSFFVPRRAFGAMAVGSGLITGMLERLAGFGPQMIMGEPGEMTFIGADEPQLGPIASSVESEFCLSVLPGVGFLPAPEFVVQARTRQTEKVIERLRKATQRINEHYREQDLPELWHESTVMDRPVFWSRGGQGRAGLLMPMVMRPVVIVTQERDANGRDRNFLVIGWTSTSPEGFARRWLQAPRSQDRVFVPSESKTDGQFWINWDVVYRVVVPYINVAVGSVLPGAMLPPTKAAEEILSDSWVKADLSYTGLKLSHAGPLPLGGFVLPSMAMAAAAPDDSGESDLARERLAAQRLEVFYHHANLFKKDVGRWPAELAELDGYVDFTGNPGLLKLDLSSSKMWRDWFGQILEPKDVEQDEDEDLHVGVKIDESLFRIDWGKSEWRLGLAPGTLEHLEKLYIDQDGKIHRVQKRPPEATSAARPDAVDSTKQAAAGAKETSE